MSPSVFLCAFVVALMPGVVKAQQCAAGTAVEIAGNWYCSAVDKITYSNFPGTGYYNKVVSMDSSTGNCETVKYDYSGSLAPLNEELSIHVRGPTWLKEMAVYTLDSTVTKRHFAKPSKRGYQHPNAHHRGTLHDVHMRLHSHPERGVGDLVTATIDGQVVHWVNEYAGPANSAHSATESAMPAQSATSSKSSMTSTVNNVKTSAASSSAPAAAKTNSGASNWGRQAYYNAGEGVSKGFTFLNHFGEADSIPGFGASLSYSSPDGKSGTNASQILSNSMLEDDVELVILSDQACDDGKCGFTRPGGLAYHGFGGDHKIFLFSFTMPMTGETGFNGDMPAIWLMNAQIPLTSQYGTNPHCSCWTSGCGELDAFEVLDSGNERCKSTLHMAPAGGSSDYFARPVKESIKAAIIFTGSNETVTIQVIDDIVAFEETLSAATVESFISAEGSVFKLAA